MVADYSELRRLLAGEATQDAANKAWNALPGLLDESERLRNGALVYDNAQLIDERNELLREVAHFKEAYATSEYFKGELEVENSARAKRIAQLEAAIQELIEGGSMDEKDMLFAYVALEGKK
jgi:hypothetical protein